MKVYSKVRAVGWAGFITTAIILVLTQVLKVEISAEIAAAILAIVTFIVGYFKKENVGG